MESLTKSNIISNKNPEKSHENDLKKESMDIRYFPIFRTVSRYLEENKEDFKNLSGTLSEENKEESKIVSRASEGNREDFKILSGTSEGNKISQKKREGSNTTKLESSFPSNVNTSIIEVDIHKFDISPPI